MLTGFLPISAAASIYLFKPPYATGSVPSLSGHAVACRWRSLLRVHRHRASKPQGSSKRMLAWQATMDQIICASLSLTYYFNCLKKNLNASRPSEQKYPPVRGGKCQNVYLVDGIIGIIAYITEFFLKNLTACRPSEHPQSGGKHFKTLTWVHGLARQNLFMAFNRLSPWQ